MTKHRLINENTNLTRHTLKSVYNIFFPGFGLLLSALIFSSACSKKQSFPAYFSETGSNAVYQRSLDLRSNLKIMSVALRPGYEDFATLAYFRLGRGALMMSVYVTNGEAGESDVQGEYPTYLAATRRTEAFKAITALGGEVRFLNLPDIVAARDTMQVRQLWPSDSLRFKLDQLVSQFQPDLILLSRDWAAVPPSLSWEILRYDLLSVVKSATSSWAVSRVAIDGACGQSLMVPINEQHPRWKKTFEQIGAETAQAYASLAVQRRLWQQDKMPAYGICYPEATTSFKRLDEGLPAFYSTRLRGLEIQVEALTEKTLSKETREALPRVTALIDSVDIALAPQLRWTERERKALLHWKGGLENLRCTLLGVEVDYTISDTLLTDRQLTYVFVNEVKGLSKEGTTEILFAGLDQNWAVNEDYAKKQPLVLKQEYRLLTPEKLAYNFPPGLRQFQATFYAKSLPMFIIHHANTKELNFVHRSVINLNFAPKFVAEVLTPIVPMVPDERAVIRLMNISRDGVADAIEVINPLVQSFRHPFRLSNKGATKLDTLTLAWLGNPETGTYIIPVQVDTFRIAQFAARKFSVEVDRTKRVGLVTGIKNSPTAEALRRLNLNFVLVPPDQNFVQRIAALDVLIIDRRALSLLPQLAALRQELDRFVERGGHLIVLAQDAAAWNAQPLWAGMRLTASHLWEADTPVQSEAGQALFNQPNLLAAADWNDWLFLRSYNTIAAETLASASIPLRASFDGNPLVVMIKAGQGKRTYVDLALSPQLMNIHAGAFRLLANLVAY